MRVFVILVLLVSCASAGRVYMKACKGVRIPDLVEIEGCNGDQCKVKNKHQVTIRVRATMPESVASLTLHGVAKWLFKEINIPFSKHAKNVCNQVWPPCPLKSGQQIDVKFTFPVNAPFAGITPNVQLHVENERSKPVFCGSMDVTLVS